MLAFSPKTMTCSPLRANIISLQKPMVTEGNLVQTPIQYTSEARYSNKFILRRI